MGLQEKSKMLKASIEACQDVQELHSLKLEVIALDADTRGTTLFEKKKTVETIQTLMRAVDIQNNKINTRQFAFEGDPIPPATTIAKPALPVQNTELNLSSLGVISGRKTTIVKDQHVLVEKLSHSVLCNYDTFVPYSVNIEGACHSVICLETKGPIFIHNVSDTILVLLCHQLRLHNAHNCTILVSVGNNRIIIENSSDLRVNGTVEVDDFSWPNKTKNPHYTNISSDESILIHKWLRPLKHAEDGEIEFSTRDAVDGFGCN